MLPVLAIVALASLLGDSPETLESTAPTTVGAPTTVAAATTTGFVLPKASTTSAPPVTRATTTTSPPARASVTEPTETAAAIPEPETDTNADLEALVDEVPPTVGEECSEYYPGVCIPPYPPDLDCGDIPDRRFEVIQPDPHGFDGIDNDGLGCESG